MATQITYGEPSRQAMLRGVDRLANAVKVTLGPRGRNVILGTSFGPPTITKDGVTVAKEIDLTDRLENLGAQMVREVASKTADVAGDGTTTATLLAQAIYREGTKNVAAGARPAAIRRGIEQAVEAVVASLTAQSQPVTGQEGFNAQTETYENLVQAGVIDPTKVVRSALQNAASIASLLLPTEAVVALMPEDSRVPA